MIPLKIRPALVDNLVVCSQTWHKKFHKFSIFNDISRSSTCKQTKVLKGQERSIDGQLRCGELTDYLIVQDLMPSSTFKALLFSEKT